MIISTKIAVIASLGWLEENKDLAQTGDDIKDKHSQFSSKTPIVF